MVPLPLLLLVAAWLSSAPQRAAGARRGADDGEAWWARGSQEASGASGDAVAAARGAAGSSRLPQRGGGRGSSALETLPVRRPGNAELSRPVVVLGAPTGLPTKSPAAPAFGGRRRRGPLGAAPTAAGAALGAGPTATEVPADGGGDHDGCGGGRGGAGSGEGAQVGSASKDGGPVVADASDGERRAVVAEDLERQDARGEKPFPVSTDEAVRFVDAIGGIRALRDFLNMEEIRSATAGPPSASPVGATPACGPCSGTAARPAGASSEGSSGSGAPWRAVEAARAAMAAVEEPGAAKVRRYERKRFRAAGHRANASVRRKGSHMLWRNRSTCPCRALPPNIIPTEDMARLYKAYAYELGEPGETPEKRFVTFVRRTMAMTRAREVIWNWVFTPPATVFMRATLGFNATFVQKVRTLAVSLSKTPTWNEDSDSDSDDGGGSLARRSSNATAAAEVAGRDLRERRSASSQDVGPEAGRPPEPPPSRRAGRPADLKPLPPPLVSYPSLPTRRRRLDVMGLLKYWNLEPFNFQLPYNLEGDCALAAQIQAHVLAKASKFVLHCPLTHREELPTMRFRSKRLNNLHVLEARLVGHDEKYPMLQPWAKFNDEQVMFFGSEGEMLFDNTHQLLYRLNTLADNKPLPKGRMFSMFMIDKEPMFLIHMIRKAGSLFQICTAGTSVPRLKEISGAPLDTPFDLGDYLGYLGLQWPADAED